MNILQWAAWGAYLTSMGTYLASVGLGAKIGIFYAMQTLKQILLQSADEIPAFADYRGYGHPHWQGNVCRPGTLQSLRHCASGY